MTSAEPKKKRLVSVKPLLNTLNSYKPSVIASVVS